MSFGCCVCSDERGWTENPLVYCDGVGCNIGVHQACYGIVSVPSGNWYCRKCESQERPTRVRCELCPSKDGALKRTDTGGWAHVVCGLYIPEVRFGSVTTMEPIVLSQIPTERYNKVCYICEQNNRGSRASMGACMQCNKAGCKQQFHVTCAQAMGLLCEEAGNYFDNVKYCGYCQEHYMKLKKSSHLKTIPPYRPISSNNSESEESPEKKVSMNMNQTPADLKQTIKRKSMTNRLTNQNGPSRATAADRKELHSQQSNIDHVNGTRTLNTPSPTPQQQSSISNQNQSGVNRENPPISNATGTVAGNSQSSKNDNSSRFTTSNFVESVITPSESVFADVQKNKKRKPNESSGTSSNSVASPLLSSISQSQQQTVQLLPTSPLPEPEQTSSKLSASADQDEDNYDDNDDDLTPLKFIEEPNLSSLKSEPVKTSIPTFSLPSTSVSAANQNNATTVISSVTSAAITNHGVSVPATSSNVNQVSAASAASTSNANVPSSTNHSTNVSLSNSFSNPVSSSYLTSKFQSGSTAPHMLGNQLNPSSSMAQKMSDALNDELEAHSIFTTADSNSTANNFVGPPLYNKIISSTRAKSSTKRSSSPSNSPLASLSSSATNFPQTLEELLETQWEQGGTFLMEQAQHFDIASLLTCLHKLREENMGLEEHIRKLKARRDHLLGVNARLAMPLAPISQLNNVNTASQTPLQHPSSTALQSIAPMNIHHQIPQQQQQQQPHHVPHSQQYQQSNASVPQMNSISENSQLRNIPLPSTMYSATSASSSTSLRGPHGSIYQNQHSVENGMMTHHQHSRGMGSQSMSSATRHHSSTSNVPLYAASQSSSNPGVVVRTPNLPMPDISRNERR